MIDDKARFFQATALTLFFGYSADSCGMDIVDEVDEVDGADLVGEAGSPLNIVRTRGDEVGANHALYNPRICWYSVFIYDRAAARYDLF